MENTNNNTNENFFSKANATPSVTPTFNFNIPGMNTQAHTISHKQLAISYFPYISPNNASRRLKQWILDDKALTKALQSTGWAVGQRTLTPLQTQYIIQAFGVP